MSLEDATVKMDDGMLDGVYNRIMNNCDKLSVLVMSLKKKNDDMFGVQPTGEKENPDKVTMRTKFSRIHDALDQQQTLLGRLETELSRVQEL